MEHPGRFIDLQTAIAGRFSLEREIGSGASAVIFLARDVALGRPVAIKLLNPEWATHHKIRERFLREARTAGVLSQPNIVPIHAVEEHGDSVFFVMGYVDGEALRQRITRTGMLEISVATRMLREVAWALAYAHARGIIHRDVKPDNIMIERDSGRAIVTDFGIAHHIDDPHGGEIVGTPDYMSPEQAMGHPVDARSDIYSLGVTAFHAITGRLPFNAATDAQLLLLHETQPAPSMIHLRTGVPGRLVEIVDRCLAKNPDDRFATADDLAAALGDVVGAMRRVPAVVDEFLSIEQNTIHRLTVLAPFGGLLTYAFGALSGFGFGHVMLVVFIAWILILELLLPPVTLLRAARNVLVQGINYDEFCEILAVQTAAADDGSTSTNRQFQPISVRRRLGLGFSGLVLAGFAFVIAGRGVVPESWRLGLVSLGVSGIILASGTVAWTLSILLGSRVNQSMRHGLWLTPFGRRFFRLAGFGLDPVAVTDRPSIRQPEAILGHAVRSALAELAGLEQREETLAVINALEAKIGVLRAQRDGVDLRPDGRDNGGVQPPFPQLMPDRTPRVTVLGNDERLSVNRSIEMAIAALEAIRLDLVRIRSGKGSHDKLMSDLAAGRYRIMADSETIDPSRQKRA